MNWLQRIFKRVTVRFDTHEDAMNALQANDTLNEVWDLCNALRMFAKHRPQGKDPMEVVESARDILSNIKDHRE